MPLIQSKQLNINTGSYVDTSSFATTGSNSFTGDQYVTGSVIVSGSISGSLYNPLPLANTTVKRSGIPNINVGVDNLVDFIKGYFWPFIPATLTLNTLSTYETGSSQRPTLIGTLTPNDETVINSRVVQVNGADEDVFTTNSINQLAPGYVTTNTTYTLKSNVGNNGSTTDIFSPTRTLSFIYPYFYGTNTDGTTPDSSQIYSGTKVIASAAGNIMIPFTGGSGKYMWFAVPQGLSKNYTAWYQTALNNGAIGGSTNLFKTKQTVTVTSTGLNQDYTFDYDVYVTNYATNTITLIFS